MAKSTYISEHLTEKQIALLKYLDDYEILYFKLSDLVSRLPKSQIHNVNELVENLYQKGLLNRIERGVYAKSTYNNIHALATFFNKNSTIAYWSALHLHGLTERFPNTVFVKTTNRKRNTEILGVPVKFVTVKENKQLGIIKEGYGDDAFNLTDVEMTIVDCFDQPRYAGDFEDLISAFAQARLTNRRLIEYTKAYQNTALTKRLGYLAELFHTEALHSFIQYAQKQVNNKYNLIDAGGIEEGQFVSRWKIRLNVSEEKILEMAQNPY